MTTSPLHLENVHPGLVWRYGLLHLPSGTILRVDNAEDMDALELTLDAAGELFRQRDEAITEVERLRLLVGDETYDAAKWRGCDRAEVIRQANDTHAGQLKWMRMHDERRDERDEAITERDAALRREALCEKHSLRGEADMRYLVEGHVRDEASLRRVRDEAITERERLRAELAEVRWALGRWESGQRRKGLPTIESVPDGTRYAAALARSQGTEGGEAHDILLVDAAMRMRDLDAAAATLLAEAVILRADLTEARAALDNRDALLAKCDQAVAALESRSAAEQDVIAKAREWRAAGLFGSEVDKTFDQANDAMHETDLALIDAVDALDQVTPSTGDEGGARPC